MKKRGYLILGILVAILSIVLVLAVEGYLTGTTGYWKYSNDTIVGSEIIELNDSQLAGAFGGPPLQVAGTNTFKTHIPGIELPMCDDGDFGTIYFEIYEKDSGIDTPGEDGQNDPIRVGTSMLNGTMNCPSGSYSYTNTANANWTITLDDINNAGTETDGIYEFFYKAIIPSEGYEKDYNNTILNINISQTNYTKLIGALNETWYDFYFAPVVGVVQFDSRDISSPTPSIDNSVYFEISGFPISLQGQGIALGIYENDSAEFTSDYETKFANISEV